MGKKDENTAFVCEHCGGSVPPLTSGSFRNHCPFCLYSKHLDIEPGDRLSDCGGLMAPVNLRLTSPKGPQILHKCLTCGFERYNMIGDDPDCPDDYELILKLMKGLRL